MLNDLRNSFVLFFSKKTEKNSNLYPKKLTRVKHNKKSLTFYYVLHILSMLNKISQIKIKTGDRGLILNTNKNDNIRDYFDSAYGTDLCC